MRIIDPLIKAMRTSYEREKIERLLIQHNRNHFAKAKKIVAYRDKIMKSLYKDKIRDKVLGGILKREEVENSDVYEFLELLTSEYKDSISTKVFTPIIVEDWQKVVKRTKRKSVSSVFSTYVVYKLVADNEEFIEALIMFYNFIIEKGIVLDR